MTQPSALAPRILTDQARITWETLYNFATAQGVADPTTQSFLVPREAPAGVSLPSEREISALSLVDGAVIVATTAQGTELRLNGETQTAPGGVVQPNVVPASDQAVAKETRFA